MRLGITDGVKHLLIINVLMFVGTLAAGNGELFYRWFALYFPKNQFFQPWQIVTHMFMHGNFAHILFNMFALWMFGTAVEQVFGLRKFLTFYLLSGLGAASPYRVACVRNRFIDKSPCWAPGSIRGLCRCCSDGFGSP